MSKVKQEKNGNVDSEPLLGSTAMRPNVKREKDVYSDSSIRPNPNRPRKRRQVAFVDLTIPEEDMEEDSKMPAPTSCVPASVPSSNVLRDIQQNAGAGLGFTLDYEGQNIPPTELEADLMNTKMPPPARKSENNTSSSAAPLRVPSNLDANGPRPSPHASSNSRAFRPAAVPSSASVSASASVTSTTRMRTSIIPLFETNHGTKRRGQRAISRREIQAAIKYGTEEPHPSDPNKIIYTYQGKKHIITKEGRRLVTTMVSTVNLVPKYISNEQARNHDDEMNIISERKVPWNSHSVIIVDISGSMRNSDVAGCRTRLGACWISIAEDFIDHRIKTGMATKLDVISIILMGENAELLIDRWPTDYILYNRILRYFEESEKADVQYNNYKKKKGRNKGRRCDVKLIRPRGHGFYGPSLHKAENMLRTYDDSSSALQVLLLSDGRPSDGVHKKGGSEGLDNMLKVKMENIASRFGQRFSFAAIGMGNRDEYDCLKNMTACCKDFGSTSTFQVPGMSCAEIGAALTAAATTLATCQTKLATQGGPRQKRVRFCLRENSRLVPLLTEVVDETFYTYMNDKVSRCDYRALDRNSSDTDVRPKCDFVETSLQHPDAKGVALKKKSFGEGQERLAFQFFELDADGESVIGDPKVAKESRFIGDELESRDKFARRFCEIQYKAKVMAKAFNKKLDSIATLDPETPRVCFIDCCVYYLACEKRGEFSVIVEPKLEGDFEKWNNNNGWHRQSSKDKGGHSVINLTEEENSEDDDAIDGVIDLTGTEKHTAYISVTRNEVAQSFSHFSYHMSRKNMLICDLQGVFDKTKNTFCFTDPVIHSNNPREQYQINRQRYGRTDMGQKGIDSFMKSHKCNRLCELVCKGFLPASNLA